MLTLDEKNLIAEHNGRLCVRKYLKDYKGSVLSSIWIDISKILNATNLDIYSGYSTEKPKELLQRIIEIGSKPGDLIMDPFCGSGSMCITAYQLDRRYLGIDSNDYGHSNLLKIATRDIPLPERMPEEVLLTNKRLLKKMKN